VGPDVGELNTLSSGHPLFRARKLWLAWQPAAAVSMCWVVLAACTPSTSPTTSALITAQPPTSLTTEPTTPPSQSTTTESDVELQLLSAPTARGWHGMVELGAGVLLVGGRSSNSSNPAWEFAAGRGGWRDLQHDEVAPWFDDEPVHGIVFDSGSGIVVVHNGYRSAGTFTYDPATDQFEQMAPGGPSRWLGGRMSYDAESDRSILFGGYGNPYSDETWAYDVDTDTWTQMNPPSNPPPRNFHVMAYDPGGDRVIMFGGGIGTATYDDTWAYDFNTDTWTDLAPSTNPGPHDFSAMVYDPAGRRMILFGGTVGDRGEPLGDTWAFDYGTNTWSDLAPVSAPSPRAWHAMAYESVYGVMVMFGGGPTEATWADGTWIYDPVANTWSPWP
jgi:hypothetical protein